MWVGEAVSTLPTDAGHRQVCAEGLRVCAQSWSAGDAPQQVIRYAAQQATARTARIRAMSAPRVAAASHRPPCRRHASPCPRSGLRTDRALFLFSARAATGGAGGGWRGRGGWGTGAGAWGAEGRRVCGMWWCVVACAVWSGFVPRSGAAAELRRLLPEEYSRGARSTASTHAPCASLSIASIAAVCAAFSVKSLSGPVALLIRQLLPPRPRVLLPVDPLMLTYANHPDVEWPPTFFLLSWLPNITGQ